MYVHTYVCGYPTVPAKKYQPKLFMGDSPKDLFKNFYVSFIQQLLVFLY